MTTGTWSTQPSHSGSNMMAAAVAVKTGIIHPGGACRVRERAAPARSR